jgi:hypothetical protein
MFKTDPQYQFEQQQSLVFLCPESSLLPVYVYWHIHPEILMLVFSPNFLCQFMPIPLTYTIPKFIQDMQYGLHVTYCNSFWQ